MIKCSCKHQPCGIRAGVNGQEGELWIDGFVFGSAEIVLNKETAQTLIGELVGFVVSQSGDLDNAFVAEDIFHELLDQEYR